MYEYIAKLDPSKRDITGIVDGDTMNVVVDLGMDVSIRIALRVMGINAPELSTQPGQNSKMWAITWFKDNCPNGVFRLNTVKDHTEKYGRYLADITAPGGANYNTDILAAGMAVPYNP